MPARPHPLLGGPERGITPGERERLTRYLLGELAPADHEAVEARYFADDEAFADLQMVEDELLEGFVRGRLDGGRAQAVRSHYLSTREGRQKMEFSRALLHMADERSPALPAAPVRRAALALAFAAGLVAAAAAAWLAWGMRGTRPELDRVHAPEARLPERDREPRGRDAELQGLGQELGRTPTRMASFVLAEGLTRDEAARVIRVPADAAVVRLHLVVEGPRRRSYVATIETAEGEEVWRARGLAARSTPQGTAVAAIVGADILPAGDYVAALSGIGADGRSRDVAAYVFRVRR
jgi:hypothetical protein